MKQVRWFRLAAFAVVALLCGTVVVNTISDPVTGATREYRAVFSNAEGLIPGSDVMIAGVRVGKVTDVELDDGLARVSFDLAADQRIPSDGVAAVRYADMLGGRFLSLSAGRGPALPEGAEIPVERTRPPLDLTALLNGFKPLFDAIDPGQVNQLAGEIVAVFDGEQGTITDLLTKVVAVTSALAEQDEVIGQVVDNLNSALGTVNQNRQQLRDLISGLAQLTSAAARQSPQIAESVDNGAALAGSLDGALGDIGPGLSQDVRSLREITSGMVRDQQHYAAAMHELPGFLTAINRAGGYGSWMNVYICNLSASAGGVAVGFGAGPHTEVCR
ncbi:MCE family protein [Saccharopolyspora flava]|uniref:Phospholipid/cholesterol/gamma-HCH transport system substrate-binding protein n=1 Tax=Saccharopolyspora flava TaxID=95161 RepID=A0A1I6SC20_9PSEU|nr:MCE family protein [Saccharopolyspora flava]SFS74489.1 phospholipid/cholesterol/gamma-HCH transport system substrate-binding protein [Saccharopolyspora flava]